MTLMRREERNLCVLMENEKLPPVSESSAMLQEAANVAAVEFKTVIARMVQMPDGTSALGRGSEPVRAQPHDQPREDCDAALVNASTSAVESLPCACSVAAGTKRSSTPCTAAADLRAVRQHCDSARSKADRPVGVARSESANRAACRARTGLGLGLP